MSSTYTKWNAVARDGAWALGVDRRHNPQQLVLYQLDVEVARLPFQPLTKAEALVVLLTDSFGVPSTSAKTLLRTLGSKLVSPKADWPYTEQAANR